MGEMNILGYSPSSTRRSFTNGIRAGQMGVKSMNIFQRPRTEINIQNNFYGNYDGYYGFDCGNNKLSTWDKIGLAFGGIAALGGAIMSGISGKDKTEGQGGKAENKAQNPDLEKLKGDLAKKATQPEPKQETDSLASYYANSNNSPVKSGGNLQDIFNNLLGVYDDCKDENNVDVKDFASAKAKNYNAATQTVTIGNHQYKIISNAPNGYLYVEDTNPRGGSNNRQVYLIEFNKTTGKYELHQRPFDNNAIGGGSYAH